MTNQQSLNNLKSMIPDLHNKDLAGYLSTKKNITPIKAAVTIVIINLSSSIILSIATNTWSATNTERGFITDYPTWAFEFILHPALIYAYFWLQFSIANVFDSILLKEKIVEPLSCIDAVKSCKERMQGRQIVMTAILVAILFGVITVYLFTKSNNESWLTRNDILAWSRGVIYSFIGYALTISLADTLIFYQTLRKIFKGKLSIKIYHPDNVGGVGEIGKFVANEGYIFFVVGLTSITVSVLYDIQSFLTLRDLVSVMYLAIYLLLLPILFVAPIWSLHKSMMASRNSKLKKISEKVSSLTESLIFKIKDQDEREKIISQLQAFNQVRSLITSTPTWPINFSNIREFFGLSIAPLLPTILPLIVSFFTK